MSDVGSPPLDEALERLRATESVHELVGNYHDALRVATTEYDAEAHRLVEAVGVVGVRGEVRLPVKSKADRLELASFHGGLLSLMLRAGDGGHGTRAVIDAVPSIIQTLPDISDEALGEYRDIKGRIVTKSRASSLPLSILIPASELSETEAAAVKAGLDSALLSQAVNSVTTSLNSATERVAHASDELAHDAMRQLLNGRVLVSAEALTNPQDARELISSFASGDAISKAMLVALDNPIVPIMGRMEGVIRGAMAMPRQLFSGRAAE